jgi:hypothetical protein
MVIGLALLFSVQLLAGSFTPDSNFKISGRGIETG